MNLMRIALVGDYPIDPSRITGGPQAVFSYLLQGLEKFTDLELHVITAHKAVGSAYTAQRDGVAFHYLPHVRLPTFLAFPSLQRSVHRLLHKIKPDLVHAQSAQIYGCIALRAEYPTVVTPHNVHGTETRFGGNWIGRLNMGLQFAATHRCFVSRARNVLSISPYIRQHYEPYVDATFHDIDNPIANSFFDLDPDYEIPYQVLFVGLLRARKRPDLALEALALARREVPELNLRFAGATTQPELKAKLDDFIAKNDLEQSVNFLGQLSETQILEAYQQTSILLLTSELETSPMAVEQAMAAGKPVVATGVGGVPFLVDDRRTGIVVEPGKPEQIARALVTLARHRELRRQMGQAGREEALSRFKADRVGQKVYDMYRAILDGS
jgi:glycosyltransferase involved in cell wall biosynthesis